MHYVDSKGILSSQNGINIYRGCTHGCIYCDSRSTCYGFDHIFEDIQIKKNAPQVLENALKLKRKKCMIGTGSMCDPYMQIESKLKLTRKCLEVIDRYGFGVTVQTKSANVLRDLDLFKRINKKAKSVIQMTLTTYDDKLCKILEPNTSTTKERFYALKKFKDNGINTIVWLSPILPFINDTKQNIEGILEYCIEAKVSGIICFGMGVTLRNGSREYFYKALDKNFPGIKAKYIKRYGNSYENLSDKNDQLMKILKTKCKENNIMCNVNECFEYLHDFPIKTKQISFFD